MPDFEIVAVDDTTSGIPELIGRSFDAEIAGEVQVTLLDISYPETRLYKDAKRKKWIVNESFDRLGGYNATMKISGELDPKYLDELCDESFRKFYFRREWLAREVLSGRRIMEDARMFAGAFGVPR